MTVIYRFRILVLLGSFIAFSGYLVIVAIEDRKNCEVTRWKHWIGFIPGLVMFGSYYDKHTWPDIAVLLVFMSFCIICGLIGVYGLADGFAFGNLALFWSGIGGVSGIGMVLLIMVLACISSLGEMLFRKELTIQNFEKNHKIAFLPHILCGYGSTILILLLRIVVFGQESY